MYIYPVHCPICFFQASSVKAAQEDNERVRNGTTKCLLVLEKEAIMNRLTFSSSRIHNKPLENRRYTMIHIAATSITRTYTRRIL